MLRARQIFQAKYGRGDELVELFKQFNKRMQETDGQGPQFRILTDVSGPFFTVVTEVDVESLTQWENAFSVSMNQPWMGEWFQKMVPLVEGGSREFYNVVE